VIWPRIRAGYFLYFTSVQSNGKSFKDSFEEYVTSNEIGLTMQRLLF